MIGETTSSVTLSNLASSGSLRDERLCQAYGFHSGPLSKTLILRRSVLRDKLYINIIRTVREPDLEHGFFTYLRKLGIPVKIESNQK
jgi:hypothetical protein